MATNLKKDLQTLNKGLKAISNKIDKLLAAADKSDKVKSEKKTSTKKPAKKLTATDTVLAVISRSKKGVDTAALMKNTGFDKKKVANIVLALKKQGKIKSEARGVYVKV